MDIEAHFRSLTDELESLRDRVRNFSVNTPHWQTDGEWKESVLRSVLRGVLPSHIEPLRGFVIAPSAGSGQIDVLLYDNRRPLLFRNGDLAFVTPDAVAGIIEVKSLIASRNQLRSALHSLADDAEVIRINRRRDEPIFVGLFSFETKIAGTGWNGALEDVRDAAGGSLQRAVSDICLGCSHFAKFWRTAPESTREEPHDAWHLYHLPRLAAGYFISNVVSTVAGESVASNQGLWFPEQSKERRRLGQLKFEGT